MSAVPPVLNDALSAVVAADIYSHGYSIQRQALPADLIAQLHAYNQAMSPDLFYEAGIGRQLDFVRDDSIRNDEICWIDGSSAAGRAWLDWAEQLRVVLNQRLMLGLFSFESHFAWYRQGHFYRRHVDAFRGGHTNRVLTLVTYLNEDWQPGEGGELVLYRDEQDESGIKVLPELGTLVVFLSEEFPHEVLPARRSRNSIAGWFRTNSNMAGRLDPPR